jgi:hypothetical protein
VSYINYGVWSEAAGGFISTDNFSMGSAENEMAWLIEQGEDPDDLTVIEMCEEHRDAEQPRDGCEMCADEDDEEEDDDGDV